MHPRVVSPISAALCVGRPSRCKTGSCSSIAGPIRRCGMANRRTRFTSGRNSLPTPSFTMSGLTFLSRPVSVESGVAARSTRDPLWNIEQVSGRVKSQLDFLTSHARNNPQFRNAARMKCRRRVIVTVIPEMRRRGRKPLTTPQGRPSDRRRTGFEIGYGYYAGKGPRDRPGKAAARSAQATQSRLAPRDVARFDRGQSHVRAVLRRE